MSNNKWKLTRRGFLVKFGLGTSFMIGAAAVSCGPLRRILAEQADTAALPYTGDLIPQTWLEILPGNKVRLHSPKVEMGQGTFTGMAQLVAEELDLSMEQIEVVHATTKQGPIDPRSTGGSDSISSLWEGLRTMSATMREMLKENAASLMGVSAAELISANGAVSGGGKSMTYEEIAAQVDEWKEVSTEPTLRSKKDFKLIGKPVPRVDLVPKVLGEAMYSMDVDLPGMLYGAVVRPALIDSSMGSIDVSAAKKIPGVVEIVQEEGFVAVVAETKFAAEEGKAALQVEWKPNRSWQQADLLEAIKVGKGKDVTIQKEGNAGSAFKEGEVIQMEFFSPIGAHAHMEPNGAVADYKEGSIDIYISTQVAGYTQGEVADRLGIKKENVNIRSTYLGGGFGRRLHTPNAMQAAVLSKAVGKPVHCFFDRKEEFQNDTFRPPTHHVMKATVGESGMIEALQHDISSGRVAFGSALLPGFLEPVLGADIGAWRGGMLQYSGIPNRKTVSWLVDLPFATSFWRSLGLLANTFAIESFMDELAHRAGKDPIEFRLAQIVDDEKGKRLKAVIEAARDKAQWGKVMPEGHVQAFACSTDGSTPVAQIIEASMEKGKPKVHKVVCSIDPGIAVNPDGIRAQCEGAIIMGLSASMYEKMEVKDNALNPTIYGAYRMALMQDAPKEIEVVILENADKPSGVGEPPLGPIGAAIGNAIFKLTGKRPTSLPLMEDAAMA